MLLRLFTVTFHLNVNWPFWRAFLFRIHNFFLWLLNRWNSHFQRITTILYKFMLIKSFKWIVLQLVWMMERSHSHKLIHSVINCHPFKKSSRWITHSHSISEFMKFYGVWWKHWLNAVPSSDRLIKPKMHWSIGTRLTFIIGISVISTLCIKRSYAILY